jgi:hypothetical protein
LITFLKLISIFQLLALEIGLRFKQADDVVSAMDYLHKNHSDEPEFRKRIKELNGILENQKDTPFAMQLLAKLDPAMFLEPLFAMSRDAPMNKIKALIALANNPSVGIEKVGVSLLRSFNLSTLTFRSNSSSSI